MFGVGNIRKIEFSREAFHEFLLDLALSPKTLTEFLFRFFGDSLCFA
jgi:hypothetical protein